MPAPENTPNDTVALTRLDHAVINTCYDMDHAQDCFSQLGFSLTPRGFHSLGSINHLMMFGTDYLELIGLPKDADGTLPVRQGISDAPKGINGLVFKTSDAQQTYQHLKSVGMAGDPPKSFSRPVQTPDGVKDAKFQTVHVRPDVCAAGRIYYCQHFTPELVWREADQQHQNEISSISEMVLVATDPDREADNFSRLLGAELQANDQGKYLELPAFRLTIVSVTAYQRKYLDLATDMNGRSAMFGAMVFETANSSNPANDTDWPIKQTDTGWRLRQPDFDCLLEFVVK